jgi:cation diffusion facilitator family transporter
VSGRIGPRSSEEGLDRLRQRAGLLSVLVGTLFMAAKFFGYASTGSTAVLSDAMESIVNVVAAGFALWALRFAGRPADRAHPYGHGKLEYFSAVFEGGLIVVAAGLILYEAVLALWRGPDLRRLDLGLAIVLGAGIGNALLGLYLVRSGRRTNSLALVADGQHVLADFWTSLGVVVGLLLVRSTGLEWLDPVVAIVVGVNLGVTGVRLVRGAGGGLLDVEDPELLRHIVEVYERIAHPGIIRVHHLRAIRAGRAAHVDAHLVVPEFWDVHRAHEVVEDFERRMTEELHVEGEIVFHTDPCRRAYCPACNVEPCPVRRAPCGGRPPLTVEEAVRPDPPLTFLDPVESP